MRNRQEIVLAYVIKHTGFPCLCLVDAVTRSVRGRIWMDRAWIAHSNICKIGDLNSLIERW